MADGGVTLASFLRVNWCKSCHYDCVVYPTTIHYITKTISAVQRMRPMEMCKMRELWLQNRSTKRINNLTIPDVDAGSLYILSRTASMEIDPFFTYILILMRSDDVRRARVSYRVHVRCHYDCVVCPTVVGSLSSVSASTTKSRMQSMSLFLVTWFIVLIIARFLLCGNFSTDSRLIDQASLKQRRIWLSRDQN